LDAVDNIKTKIQDQVDTTNMSGVGKIAIGLLLVLLLIILLLYMIFTIPSKNKKLWLKQMNI